MFSLLHSYLLEHRTLLLPGIGKLQLVRSVAVYDVVNQAISAPVTQLVFIPGKESVQEGFIAFLAQKHNLENEAAQSLFTGFCQKLKQDVQATGLIAWPGLGVFEKDGTGMILFRASEALSAIHQPVAANRIIRQGNVHNMVVGDAETTSVEMEEYFAEHDMEKRETKWWVAAVIAGGLAIALIILKKMQLL